ncbi:integrase, catalytic region, zinc finger, CCHC-type containing protein [Tanacetum coccineum]
MTTLAENIIVVGAKNRPPILEKSMYDSWENHIRLFIKGKKNGRMMLDSIDSDECDIQATNIVLHGLPPDVYALVNHHEAAMDIWDRAKLLMKGTELSYQERECRLYNLFDKMTMQQVQVNTKFLNALPLEWSKFVTDVKLAKNLYTTNYDQLYAYLSQHEQEANEVRIMHERYLDPLALVANSQTLYNPSQSPQHSVPLMHPSRHQFTPVYAAPTHHQHYHTLDSSLVVHTFQQGEYPIECINKAMAFLSIVVSRFPPLNNQLRTSLKPRNQATIQDGRVTIQQVQGRQTQSFTVIGNKGIATTSRGNSTASQARVVKCYNCLGEGHMNSAFQTKDLDAYDSNYDDISSVKVVLMENLSNCDSDVLFEVPYFDTYLDDMINQDVQEMPYQAFWLKHSNHTFDTSVESHTPVKIEAPSELPKVSLVNESLKKLKYHLASFDKVVKKRTTSDAITVDEITEVQNIFNQMEAPVDQCSEIRHIAMNSVDILDMSKSCVDECKKDTVIRNLKDMVKSMSGKESVEKVKKDIDEIEIINIEQEHSVAKLLFENKNLRKEREHLKLIYKDQFDSIKKTRVRSKEHNDSLIAQINAKSVENSDLNAQLQEKIFAIAALKNELRTFKGKYVVDTAVSTLIVTTIAPGIAQVDQGSQIKMIQVKEMMQDNDLKNLKSKDKGSKSRSQSMDEQSHYKQDKTITRQSINVKRHIFNVIGDTEKFEERDLNIGGDCCPIVSKFLGIKGSNLYTLSLENLFLSSPIRLLSKDSKTKSWLWHRRLSHLNFDYVTSLVKQGLVRGLPKLKYQKDQLCSACALVEAARTMLIFLKALLFLWPKAVATACYTQNRSLIRKRHNKTPYELLHDRKPDSSYLHVFGALCYPTNDSEVLGKLKPKADIGIFVGYAPRKKAFRIYNKRTL